MTTSEREPRPSFRETVWGDLQGFAALKGVKLGTTWGLLDVLLFPGVMAVLLFRVSSLFHQMHLRPVSRLLYILNVMLFGADIAPGARIGPGFTVPHPVGVTIGGPVVMGRDVHIFVGVGIGGGASLDDPHGFPTIGDRVWIFAGAMVFGNIVIGQDAQISANSFVRTSVPPGAIMVGNPARLVTYRPGYGPKAVASTEPAEPVGTDA
jgi:serine O-acetyltransferase